MIQAQLKLRLCKSQVKELERWLYHLESVWNWGVRKIELNAANKIYFRELEFKSLLAWHGEKLDIPAHTLCGVLLAVHQSWRRCFKKLAGKPRLKGRRNRMNSIPFPDPFRPPIGNRIVLPFIGSVRFHRMALPEGTIKCGRLVRRASGWYLCLFIDAQPNAIRRLSDGAIGVDPGFKSLLTTSDGEIVEHPRELNGLAASLARAQRGKRAKLTARIRERIANQRKDRNHKLSRRLVAENSFIAWSCDTHSAISRRFGKSVSDSGHYQLRAMLAYKSRLGGTLFVEVPSRYSTMTCSACGALSGPTGLRGLAVRQWQCEGCGTHHDRDINAAKNTLRAGLGTSLGVQKPEKSGVHCCRRTSNRGRGIRVR